MTRTRLKLSGCDDSTKVDVELTGDQRALLERLAELIEAKSEYSCQPRLYVGDSPELCTACKPGGRCTDPYEDGDPEDCSTAIAERRQRAQEGTTTP